MSIRCLGCMKIKTQSPVCEHCGYNENIPNYAHQLPIGTVLHGQYTVGKVLGQGGFGITYIGWDDALEAPVAIKEYYPNSFVTRECTVSTALSCTSREMEELFFHNRDRFLREARMLARLQDVPGIVRVHNLFRENNTAYIVMEYVEGIDLKRYIRTLGRTLTVGETLAVLRPVMDALSLVHQAELVHRDISPDNIMIRPDGSAKLLDFGAAREVENADVEKNLSQSTESILKHGFAPIEQYQRRGNLGPWTDVYALCATVYYCLTGKVPADAPERMIEQAEVNWNAIPGLTPKQAEVFAKGMAVLPKDRIRSIRELYQSLRDSATVSQTQRKTAEKKPSKPVINQETPVPVVTETKKEEKPKKPILPIAAAALALVAAIGLFAMKPKETPGTAAAPEIRPAATESAISEALSEEELRYQEAEALEAAGEYGKAAIAFGKLGDYADARERNFGLWAKVPNRKTLSFYMWSEGLNSRRMFHALREDGTIAVDSFDSASITTEDLDQYLTAEYQDIVSIHGVVGLRSDGTVAVPKEPIVYQQEELETWTDIIALSIGGSSYVGLKADGTVVTAGSSQFDVSDWSDITAIAHGGSHVVGLKSDGTVVLYDASNGTSKLEGCLEWTDIIAISARDSQIFGLKADGSVITVGLSYDAAIKQVQGQKNVVALEGPYAIKADGTVVGLNSDKWNGVVSIVSTSSIPNYGALNSSDLIAIRFDGTLIFGRGDDGSFERARTWTDIQVPNIIPTKTLSAAPAERTYTQIATGLDHTVVLFSDGTVEAIGSNEYGQCDVEDWRNIIRISANDCLTMGLQSDGTVLLAGNTDPYGQEVYGWQNITDISAGKYHLLGLMDDGTVVSSGGAPRYADTSSWDDIVSIGTAYTNSVGLRENGTVVTKGTYRDGDLLGWNKIISISVSDAHFLGLRSDGTVMAAGSNSHDQCDVDTWTDIIAVGAGCGYSVGLRGNGTVLVQGLNDNGQHEARSWTDIVYISVGLDHIIGVKADGTFVATGDNQHGECSVEKFNP